MKKIICIIGIICLVIILVLNLLFTTRLDFSECTTTVLNNYMYIIFAIILAILICILTKLINNKLYKYDTEKNKKARKCLIITSVTIYILFNVIWLIAVNPYIVADSVHVSNMAQMIARGTPEEFLNSTTYAGITLKEYMQAYPHQISLAFVYSIFFKLIHFDIIELLRILNLIGNIAIVFAIYKIGNKLSKEYVMNKVLLLTLILTFTSLTLLSTFIYGDIPSLALSLFSIYFMMKYIESKNIKYTIFAAIFSMVAYMMRMNTLIFIIATVIYLLFNLFKEFTKNICKRNLINIGIIIAYVLISIVPTSLVKGYFFNKYDLDKNKKYPIESYLIMAMQESPRGNGWYNEDIASRALRNPIEVKKKYRQEIKERVKYFFDNIGECINFYIMKTASMWTENTYSAIVNNPLRENKTLESIEMPLKLYQKGMLLLIVLCSIIVLIQNRKNISLELIYLLTVFIGGFLFHLLWEAKSRYIITYIVVLIPIASICIKKLKNKYEQ